MSERAVANRHSRLGLPSKGRCQYLLCQTVAVTAILVTLLHTPETSAQTAPSAKLQKVTAMYGARSGASYQGRTAEEAGSGVRQVRHRLDGNQKL